MDSLRVTTGYMYPPTSKNGVKKKENFPNVYICVWIGYSRISFPFVFYHDYFSRFLYTAKMQSLLDLCLTWIE